MPMVSSLRGSWPELPKLNPHQVLDLPAIRDALERLYLAIVLMPALALACILGALVAFDLLGLPEILILVSVVLVWTAFSWVAWKLLLALICGHAIEVTEGQYPQVYSLIREACTLLQIDAVPKVYIMHGAGTVELFVAKQFSKRGVLLITSNLLDDLTRSGTSREFMFLVGRQLGLIRIGFFDKRVLKHVIGAFTLWFYWAWQRRCHYVADRIGLLVAGDLYSAEQALLLLTVGEAVAPITNLDAVRDQRSRLFESLWSWIALGFSTYPFLVDRLIALREFARVASERGIRAGEKQAVGALGLAHRPIRAVPVMLLHGHDAAARTELEIWLLREFPHVSPVAMIAEVAAADTLPEKFESIANRVSGAVAILTPDDSAMVHRTGASESRARQNVIIELGYFWARLGRGRCLLLMKGDVNLPSDLSGIEVHRYSSSPMECARALQGFVEALEPVH